MSSVHLLPGGAFRQKIPVAPQVDPQTLNIKPPSRYSLTLAGETDCPKSCFNCLVGPFGCGQQLITPVPSCAPLRSHQHKDILKNPTSIMLNKLKKFKKKILSLSSSPSVLKTDS